MSPEQRAVHTEKRQLRLQQPGAPRHQHQRHAEADGLRGSCGKRGARGALPSPATNHRSSTVFTTVATPMMSSGVRESPTPRSTAESAL